jgi:hypothetical protein
VGRNVYKWYDICILTWVRRATVRMTRAAVRGGLCVAVNCGKSGQFLSWLLLWLERTGCQVSLGEHSLMGWCSPESGSCWSYESRAYGVVLECVVNDFSENVCVDL